jgi:hypothetical protein
MPVTECNGGHKVVCDCCPAEAPTTQYFQDAEGAARHEGFRHIILDSPWPAWRRYKWVCRGCASRLTLDQLDRGQI